MSSYAGRYNRKQHGRVGVLFTIYSGLSKQGRSSQQRAHDGYINAEMGLNQKKKRQECPVLYISLLSSHRMATSAAPLLVLSCGDHPDNLHRVKSRPAEHAPLVDDNGSTGRHGSPGAGRLWHSRS
jgi:hypothetical protein